MEPGEVAGKIGMPDMLVHTDRNDLVELCLARQVAVVLQADLDLAGEPAPLDPRRRVVVLVAADRDADAPDAVILGGEFEKTAPAAADVEQPLARTQSELLADMVELLLLRGVDILVAALEIGAGIDHPAPEPEGEELVRYVVVIANPLRVRRPGVRPAQPRQQLRGAKQPAEFLEPFRERDADLDDVVDAAFDAEIALDIGPAQRIDIAAQQLAHQAPSPEVEGNARLCAEIDRRAVVQAQADRQVEAAQPGFQPVDQRMGCGNCHRRVLLLLEKRRAHLDRAGQIGLISARHRRAEPSMQAWYHCENTYPFVPQEVLDAADSVRASLPNKYCDPKLAADLFQECLDEHVLCDELGINIVSIEHHSGINSLYGASPMILGIAARQTRN